MWRQIVHWITSSISTWKFQAQTWGEHVVYRTIFVHNMFSPCSAKRRASDKNLPVPREITTILLCWYPFWSFLILRLHDIWSLYRFHNYFLSFISIKVHIKVPIQYVNAICYLNRKKKSSGKNNIFFPFVYTQNFSEYEF